MLFVTQSVLCPHDLNNRSNPLLTPIKRIAYLSICAPSTYLIQYDSCLLCLMVYIRISTRRCVDTIFGYLVGAHNRFCRRQIGSALQQGRFSVFQGICHEEAIHRYIHLAHRFIYAECFDSSHSSTIIYCLKCKMKRVVVPSRFAASANADTLI